MELALMAGKLVVIALIYLFVFMVYRGLLRQSSPVAGAPVSREPRAPAPQRLPVIPAAAPPAPVAPAVSLPSQLQEALREEPAPAPSVPEALAPLPLPAVVSVAPESVEVVVGMSRLTVIHSETPEIPLGREFPLLAAATLGRAEYNAIALPDHFASQQHSLIFLQEGRRVLRDRGSTNGTCLNGKKITEDMILRNGDEITVGTTVLRYTQPDSGTP
jgi:hypothetical protein